MFIARSTTTFQTRSKTRRRELTGRYGEHQITQERTHWASLVSALPVPQGQEQPQGRAAPAPVPLGGHTEVCSAELAARLCLQLLLLRQLFPPIIMNQLPAGFLLLVAAGTRGTRCMVPWTPQPAAPNTPHPPAALPLCAGHNTALLQLLPVH